MARIFWHFWIIFEIKSIIAVFEILIWHFGILCIPFGKRQSVASIIVMSMISRRSFMSCCIVTTDAADSPADSPVPPYAIRQQSITIFFVNDWKYSTTKEKGPLRHPQKYSKTSFWFSTIIREKWTTIGMISFFWNASFKTIQSIIDDIHEEFGNLQRIIVWLQNKEFSIRIRNRVQLKLKCLARYLALPSLKFQLFSYTNLNE